MANHDIGNTNRAIDAAAPDRPLTERWRQPLPERDASHAGPGPVVAGNRILVVWTREDGSDSSTRMLVTYDLFTGEPGWQVALSPDQGPFDSAYLTGGRLLLDDGNGSLSGFDPTDGTKQWNTTLSGLDKSKSEASRPIPSDNRLYGIRYSVEADGSPNDAVLTALGKEGNVCSKTTPTFDDFVSVAAAGHGRLYFGGSEIHSYDLQADEFIWQRSGPTRAESLVVGSDRIFVGWTRSGDQSGAIGAYDPTDGSVLWERTGDETTRPYWPQTMSVGDETLLVGEQLGPDGFQIVARVAATGEQLWSVETSRTATPVIADDVVYVAQDDSEIGPSLGLYDLESGQEIARHSLPAIASDPVIASGHVLLIARDSEYGDFQLVGFR
ncbi:WD40/PQQ-like beta propeller repeat containing protein [Halorhabdus sp. SVX81]|uniref:outer membrane protein assembly factor BamB family protein n=1 Tax=Halorhabdus sp. SVX81 TaxID=2978283 RepID=UPI0023DB3DDE|nr:PQQ-binding-like beta-propeller repeat protein [Halorhabdus sp. SVX81]WEL18690.1 WD40/PQQ-like beta propeller repeat containing protein [Halorhabdus sp. SVX81]